MKTNRIATILLMLCFALTLLVVNFAVVMAAPMGPTIDCLPGRSASAAGMLITGYAWHDNNLMDGLNDTGTAAESMIDGVVVTATCLDPDTGITNTWTVGTGDSGTPGEYTFEFNPSSDPANNIIYTISFVPPAGYVPTWSNAGMNDALDSDVDALGQVTFGLVATQTVPSYDAGFVTETVSAYLEGTVWIESVVDGQLTRADSQRKGGVELSIECPDLITDGLSATTDEDGRYAFNMWYDPLLDTDCDISIDVPSPLYLTIANTGSEFSDSDFDQIFKNAPFHLDSTVTNLDLDAGLTKVAPTAVQLSSAAANPVALPVIFTLLGLLTLVTIRATRFAPVGV